MAGTGRQVEGGPTVFVAGVDVFARLNPGLHLLQLAMQGRFHELGVVVAAGEQEKRTDQDEGELGVVVAAGEQEKRTDQDEGRYAHSLSMPR